MLMIVHVREVTWLWDGEEGRSLRQLFCYCLEPDRLSVRQCRDKVVPVAVLSEGWIKLKVPASCVRYDVCVQKRKARDLGQRPRVQQRLPRGSNYELLKSLKRSSHRLP